MPAFSQCFDGFGNPTQVIDLATRGEQVEASLTRLGMQRLRDRDCAPALPEGGCVMSAKDIDYFRERAMIERAMAHLATHPQATAAHLELAARYDERVQRSEASKLLKRGRHAGIRNAA